MWSWFPCKRKFGSGRHINKRRDRYFFDIIDLQPLLCRDVRVGFLCTYDTSVGLSKTKRSVLLGEHLLKLLFIKIGYS